MKKFSDKINESSIINYHQKEEIEFLLNRINLSIDDLEDLFINFLDKGDHLFGINIYYYKNYLSFTDLNKEHLNKEYVSKIELKIFLQSEKYNNVSFYSKVTREKGIYTQNEIDLIEEYIFCVKTLTSISNTDKIKYNTLLEQLNIIIEFENSDEILDGLKEIKERNWS
jgi:hypothetical protein